VLPHDGASVSGCLVPDCEQGNRNQPSEHGPLLYFNCQGRLDEAIAAVQTHGGKVLAHKHSIGAHGFRAIVLDSEGNRIALHSI
jgi:predicted enzyme related to lactoylglutathione lyase